MKQNTFTFALGSDVHCEIMHDGMKRLKAFVNAAEKENASFLVHLGDFCRSKASHKKYVNCWNSFSGEKHMVLGNHDSDSSDKLTMLRFLGMERAYYSFDFGGFHFCVLDTNTVTKDGIDYDYARGNYFVYEDIRENISQSQLQWLKEDISATDYPCVLFSHASLHNRDGGVRNMDEVHATLVELNRKAGYSKVFASLNGHNHVDSHIQVDGIHYIDINSMSNCWLGGEYKHRTYGPLVDFTHPGVPRTTPYRDSLFTMVHMDAQARTMVIEGMKTKFVGKSPKELGHCGLEVGFPITPQISRYEICF